MRFHLPTNIVCVICIVCTSASVAENATQYSAAELGTQGEVIPPQFRRTLESRHRSGLKRFGLQTKRYAGGDGGVDVVHTRISEATIERLLKQMKYGGYTKSKNGNGTVYSFRNRHNFRVELTLFTTQTNIMMYARFPSTTLAKINQYNLLKYLVRAVQYTRNNVPYTALESNLLCSQGVTETMIRYFINRYDLDVRHFAGKLFRGKQE